MLRTIAHRSAATRVLDDRDHSEVLALCERDPAANVFVSSRVRAAGLDQGAFGAQIWGYYAGRELVSTPARFRPGASEVMALRVGYDKLREETGWEPKISWEEGIRRTIAWYAANRERWIGRVDWLTGAQVAKQ